MAALRNVSGGFRGLCLAAGGEAMFDPGEVREIDLTPAELDDALATGWFEEAASAPVAHDPLDHDGDGRKGGSRPRRKAGE